MNIELWVILLTVAIFAAMLGCLELGFRNGQRQLARAPDASQDGIGAIEGAVFGLLGLLLAFTLAGSTNRLDQRRQLIVQEANAIGTAFLRLDLLPPPSRESLHGLFRDYVETRLSIYRDLNDRAETQRRLNRANEQQQVIWTRAVSEAQADASGNVAKLLLPAINEMIDVTTARTIAARTHLPMFILLLLVVMAMLSGLLAGYSMSRRRSRSWLHMVLYSAVVAITIYGVLDLDYPRFGLIRLNAADEAMQDLLKSIQ